MTDEATVEISAAKSAAEVVLAETVRKGDCVFDTSGGTHEVKSVLPFVHVVRITRVDGVQSTHEIGDTITIVRAIR